MKKIKDGGFASVTDVLIMLLSIMPKGVTREISALALLRRDFPLGLSEIRVRAEGRSSIVLSGENIPLFTPVSPSELRELYDKALGAALYAHTDEIKRGFISMPYGVRVGISAERRAAELLPLDVRSLVFRLPSAPSENAGAIFSLWYKKRPRGMLLYSAPGEGKTSALRALAGLISREAALRVAVIDERREFIREHYSDCSVDILSGYGKAEGIEIAMRTLSPEVIIVDEIGSVGEADSLISVGKGGIPIIATAHAESLSEVLSRACVKELYEAGYFDTFIRLSRVKGKFFFECQGISQSTEAAEERLLSGEYK